MSLEEEIMPYVQWNGLISDMQVPSGSNYPACDHGVLYTSEYLILNLPYYFVLDTDNLPFIDTIQNHVSYRYQSADDFCGAYAALIQHGVIPKFRLRPELRWYPQLIALAAIASKNLFYRVLATPFILYAAWIIATSCIGADMDDYDRRIRCWVLIKGTESSWACQLAAKLWRRDLLRTYLNGMKDVFSAYFTAEHPLAKYMGIY